MNRTIARALISVSDKSGIVGFARHLADAGIELISTGGTAAVLADAGIPVTPVSDVTGFPEIMAGRVKTLHPRIHGGLLGRRGQDDAVMAEHGIPAIDLLVLNLYPFQETVAQSDCTLEQAVENIDIGGPAMLRAAAKNHADVGVVVDPADYDEVLEEIDESSNLSLETRQRLATKAFAHTARYDGAIASYLQVTFGDEGLPPSLTLTLPRVQVLRYGENPHQAAALYRDPHDDHGIAYSEQIQGKEISYNNLADADAALECVKQFEEPACVIVKHANPCGVAIAADLSQAYDLAYATDPVSAFGGIVAFNGELDGHTAATLIERQFVEVVIAPSFSEVARSTFENKPNVRLLACGELRRARTATIDYRTISGGVLAQERDFGTIGRGDTDVVTERGPEDRELADLLFAWRVAKFIKSNAIVYARDQRTIGIGAGQMSRVYSARLGIMKAEDAGLEIAGSVMASDAFFPFSDSVDAAAAAGVTAIIQPGGSIRDEDVVAAADQHGLAMVFTGMRHFRH
jgi:phosphoribosylaminoimidazolecarboxamide formyltransferase / IMP cyclohydrolase